MSYRWNGAHDWLADKLEGIGEDALLAFAQRMSQLMDADDIQEAFQEEMDADGYFEEVPPAVQDEEPPT